MSKNSRAATSIQAGDVVHPTDSTPHVEVTLSMCRRPIRKLELSLRCEHPLLQAVQLMTTQYTAPAGIIPVVLLIPDAADQVPIFLNNLASVIFEIKIEYDAPVVISSSLSTQYDGMLLVGDAFDDLMSND